MEKFLEYLVRAFRTRADSASKGMVTQHPPMGRSPMGWAGTGICWYSIAGRVRCCAVSASLDECEPSISEPIVCT